MRKSLGTLAVLALLVVFVAAEDKERDQSAGTMAKSLNVPAAICTFSDGKQLTVRYKRTEVEKKEGLPVGKRWPSDEPAMVLFTPVGLVINDAEIPPGAFSLYVIPEKDDWTLVVNRNVDESAKYDETQDLVRAPMKIGEIGQPVKEFTVYFAHIAPKQCNLRLYYGKTGSWAEFSER
jgi:hypothetical protein